MIQEARAALEPFGIGVGAIWYHGGAAARALRAEANRLFAMTASITGYLQVDSPSFRYKFVNFGVK